MEAKNSTLIIQAPFFWSTESARAYGDRPANPAKTSGTLPVELLLRESGLFLTESPAAGRELGDYIFDVSPSSEIGNAIILANESHRRRLRPAKQLAGFRNRAGEPPQCPAGYAGISDGIHHLFTRRACAEGGNCSRHEAEFTLFLGA
jgi:hypothetical protein